MAIGKRRHRFRVTPPFSLAVTFWLSWLAGFSVFASYSNMQLSMDGHTNTETDRLALLSFKSMISGDPFHALASWNTSIHFCEWRGVVCEGRSGQQRVASLALDSLNLTGSISPSLSNLTFLQNLSLSGNTLHGLIPQELGFLVHLQKLNLSRNMLEGEIPLNIGHCWSLRIIDLQSNTLTGTVPRSFGKLQFLTHLFLDDNQLQAGDWAFISALANCSNLRVLGLGSNKLSGMLPASIANLSAQVQTLSMTANKVSGNIPLEIGNLFNLQRLILSDNKLTDAIPASIGKLFFLTELDLSNNQLSGSIPPSLANLSALTWLDLANNSLTGGIPTSLGNLNSLNLFDLEGNHLVGTIPSSLGNLSALSLLQLSRNNLTGGIPSSLGSCSNLRGLDLATNFISGIIPPSLWNSSSLRSLVMYSNNLSGTLPPDMGLSVPSIKQVLLFENQFHGPIPLSLSNASSLKQFDIGSNKFSGNIPQNLGELQLLSVLILQANELGEMETTDWSIITALTNNTNLKVLDLAGNRLGGSLPKTITNLSNALEWLNLGGNRISGVIPTDIGHLVNLRLLALDDNLFYGSIPSTIGTLKELHMLVLLQNQLSGTIPQSLGNLTKLNNLQMGNNYLDGSIPTSLGNCLELEQLNLENNKLKGNIPKEIFAISTLSMYLDLANNSLEGPLPAEVGNLINLVALDVSNNKLSGVIPVSLSKCQVLQQVFMEGNLFHGPIPSYLSDLKGLQQLDISRNNLSGPIPKFLESLSLAYLNLSFNDFESEVPLGGVFSNASAISILGNAKLCGGNPKLKLPPCKGQGSQKKSWSTRLTVITVVAAAILFAISFICFILIYLKCKKRKETSAVDIKEQHRKVSYAELVKATDGFSTLNLIGTGSFGFVYKGILEQLEQQIVAVKVLNLHQRGASRSFIAECEALRNIRHRNLVKILTSCSTIDFQGNDFKALVFEFLPNGSLEKWLHPSVDREGDQRKLGLPQRLNIAIDVASAVEYLHHYRPMPIVHCDLKPSNVLLDYEMTAHVGDFGLARFLHETQSTSLENTSSSIQLKGSIGYVAPEYGMGNIVSIHGDTYSYGILLLEMLTGRRPTDDAFKDGMNLHNFVEKALPDRLVEIIDPFLLVHEEGDQASNNNQKVEGCLLSLLKVGIMCSKVSPMERMQIEEVTWELNTIRNELLRIGM